MAVDQSLQNTPETWAKQQALIQQIAQAALRGESYEMQSAQKSPEVKFEQVEAVTPKIEKSEKLYSNSNVFEDLKGFKKVKLVTKDVSCILWALDVCVTDAYIAFVLPKAMEVQDMRMKAKFNVVVDEAEYSVMFIGGNFEFNLASTPLRILSFARLSGNISK
jgi:hypothetical protein